MGLTGWSTSNYLSASSMPITAYPFLVSSWFITPGNATDRYISALGVSDTDFNGLAPSASGRYQALSYKDPALGAAQSGVGAIPTSTWNNYVGTFNSTTSRDVYKDGTGKFSDTTTVVPSTPTILTIGVSPGFLQPLGSDEGVAEASIWDTTGFSSTDRDNLAVQLATSANPMAINTQAAQAWTGKLVWYRRLFNTAGLNVGTTGSDLTMTGTLTNHASHPTVDAPPASSTTNTPGLLLRMRRRRAS